MKKIIHWFRQDLRLSDNPALYKAAKAGQVIAVYILDDENAAANKMGAASRVWLHHSLEDLNQSLNGHLAIFKGNPIDILKNIIANNEVSAIHWNRCYEPWRVTRDKAIKEKLNQQGIEVQSFNGSLLWEPWEISKKDGTPYKVFTPFYRKGCLSAEPPRTPLPPPENTQFFKITGNPVAALGLLPDIDWNEQIENHWLFGEQAAQKRLKEFLDDGLNGYKEGRNFPNKNNVSRLSPYLHFGEISPNQAWHAAINSALAKNHENDLDCFQSELGWREFLYHLLYHFPELPGANMNKKFDAFPWEQNKSYLLAWQKGQTGIPIIDAGLRELWQTGYMHNRVRMVVASFLVKNLRIHWKEGERWFWDCLFDADLANNVMSWQWVAGCGADAAPYFRIFNPLTQSRKFDAQGTYIRRFVPELKDMPDKHIHAPWDAPKDILDKAGIILDKDYPKPIIDLKTSRERALEAYNHIKG